MSNKAKKTLLDKLRSSSAQGPRNRLGTLLKWVGGVTAVLSLFFGLYQLTQLVADVRERQRQVAELYEVGKDQQDVGDYESAWASFEKAVKSAEAGGLLAKLTGSLSKEQRRSRDAQEDLAMAWVENMKVPQGKTFSNVVNPLVPVLTRGATGAGGVRKADLLAHVGWANFLISRDGVLKLDIDEKYSEALRLDPDNPFAHAMRGHWLIVNGDHLMEAQQEFAAALKSGRERQFVRKLQLAALQWVRTDEDMFEIIRVFNEMRKDNESLPEETRSRILRDIYSMYREELLAKLDQILPADEHLATYQWLLQGSDATKSNDQTFFLARLSEAAGDCDRAQRLYVFVLNTRMSREVREGLERCKRKSPQLKSEVELLTESLNDKRADVRREAVEGLSALLAGGAKIDLKVIVPALRDPDSDVRTATAEALVRSGRKAVPLLIELLSSEEPAEQARAVRVLARMGAQSKAAVPALVKMLGSADNDTQEAVLEALANIGPDASAAVVPIRRMLGEGPSLDRRKALIYTLGEIGPASRPTVPLIIEALRDQSDSEGFLNVVAARALSTIGPGATSAISALIAALESDDGRLVTATTEALGSIGAEAKAAIPALVEAMVRQEPEHKKNQAEAIGQIAQALAVRRDRSSLKVLRAALRAEEDAGLGVATVAPLREAIDDLESGRP